MCFVSYALVQPLIFSRAGEKYTDNNALITSGIKKFEFPVALAILTRVFAPAKRGMMHPLHCHLSIAGKHYFIFIYHSVLLCY